MHEDSREFHALLNDPRPDYDAAMFAVRNLGFIAIKQHGAALEIILHPRSVERRAVDAAIAMLGSLSATLFRITYLTDSWQPETLASARDAATRLAELCRPED